MVRIHQRAPSPSTPVSLLLRPVTTACLLALATLLVYSLDLQRAPISRDEARVLSAAQQPVTGLPPLMVQSGDTQWLQPLGVYLTKAVHAVFPGYFAGRWASVGIASLNVALIFLVGWQLFGHWLPALAAAAVLASMPAHFAFGRHGTDALYSVPFLLAWLLALAGVIRNDRPAAMAAAGAALGAGVYANPSAPLTMAFLWMVMIGVLWVNGRRSPRMLAAAAGGFAVMLLPLAVWFLRHPASYPDTFGRWAIHAAHIRSPLDLAKALANTNTLGTRASHYWGLLDPSYLFFAADGRPAPLLLLSAPLVALGIYRCVKAAPRADALLLLAAAAVAPLAGSAFGAPRYLGDAAGLLAMAALLAGAGAAFLRDLVRPPAPPAEES